MGLRDYAMFLLIATYGLRASEVVAITLDDIHWRQGILRIHQRKTSSPLELPLTNEVLSALVKHLKRTPPPAPYRRVFLRMRAPTRAEVDGLLAAPDQRTWSGRRDHAFMLLAVQTGLRLSEMTGLKREDIIFGTGAHVRVIGKGRKERCTPLARSIVAVLKTWVARAPTR